MIVWWTAHICCLSKQQNFKPQPVGQSLGRLGSSQKKVKSSLRFQLSEAHGSSVFVLSFWRKHALPEDEIEWHEWRPESRPESILLDSCWGVSKTAGRKAGCSPIPLQLVCARQSVEALYPDLFVHSSIKLCLPALSTLDPFPQTAFRVFTSFLECDCPFGRCCWVIVSGKFVCSSEFYLDLFIFLWFVVLQVQCQCWCLQFWVVPFLPGT